VDGADEGLQVVAGFLEQVVSQTELEITDVTIRIQHESGISVTPPGGPHPPDPEY
jgi:hypothetical protein